MSTRDEIRQDRENARGILADRAEMREDPLAGRPVFPLFVDLKFLEWVCSCGFVRDSLRTDCWLKPTHCDVRMAWRYKERTDENV